MSINQQRTKASSVKNSNDKNYTFIQSAKIYKTLPFKSANTSVHDENS